jgi:hypothetical protein
VSAADNQWPAWLRRHTGIELLGPPRAFFAWVVVAISLLTIAYVGAWNATVYPIPLGYDAQGHTDYAHTLIRKHHLPTPAESGEANQPPAYYAIAGGAAALGQKLFGWHETEPYTQMPEVSYRGALILNVLFVFLTALCVLWLARLVAPDRPWVWAASVGFFAFLPVVMRTAAMFHPDNLAMLTSTAALAATTDMLVRRAFRPRLLVVLALSLGLGLATRASTIFTVAAIAVGLGVAMADDDFRALVQWRRVGAGVGAVLLLAVPWLAYRAIVHHKGPINDTAKLIDAALHPGTHNLSDRLTVHRRFFNVYDRRVFTAPYRSNYKNEAFLETYTEMWGDWIASFAWSQYSIVPWGPAQQVLKDQSYIGVLPTFLAIFGWIGLCVAAVRRNRALLALAVMPVFGVGGYLYRSWVTLTHDGDLFKATYALNTVGVWAIGFALATGWLASRSRLLRYAMIALFSVFAVLELRFMLYGVRDHRPIF